MSRQQISRKSRRMSATGACAGLLLACAGTAHGDTFYWAAQGGNNHLGWWDTRANGEYEFRPLTGYLDVYGGGLTTDILTNLFRPTQPGGVTGSFATRDMLDELRGSWDTAVHHLIFANALHADRTAKIDLLLWVRTMQFTTRGDVYLAAADVGSPIVKCRDWFVRWPTCTGNLTVTVDVFTDSLWLGGSGEVIFRSALSQWGGGAVTKSGNATVVIDPQPLINAPVFGTDFNVRRGALIIRGNEGGAIFSNDLQEPMELRLGTEFGGQDSFPTGIPYPSWEVVDLNPNPITVNPVVYIQRNNVIPDYSSLRLGASGTAVFDAPGPINFEGNIVSHAPGLGLVVQGGAFTSFTTFADNVLNNFTGPIRIDAGTLRTPTPNPLSPIVLNSPRNSTDAVLDIQVASGTQSFQSTYSGFGQLAKSGNGTLNLVDPAPAFTGDYRVIAGTLGTSATPNSAVLKNSVTVSGGTLLNRAAENIDDATTMRLSGGVWDLNGFTETVSQLLISGGSSVALDGGTLRLAGNLLASPGPSSTGSVVGPGTLHFTGTSPRTIDVGTTTAPVGLDISATVSGAPIVITGQGVAQFSGAFTSPSLEIRTGTARLNIPAAGAKPAAVTVGYADPFNPDAPMPNLELGRNDQLSDTASVSLVNRAIVNLHGFSDTIGGLVVNGAGPFAVGAEGGELGLAGNASFNGGGLTNVYGPLNLLGGSRNWTINAGSTVFMTGAVNSGTINKLGPGALYLDTVNGSFTLNNSGATTSATRTSVGGVAGSGTIFLETAFTIDTPAGTQRGYGGSFAGAGALIKTGPGMQELNAGVANTHTGGTRVEGGTLFLNRFPGTTVIPGGLTVADGSTLLYAFGADNQVADATDVIVDVGGVVRMDGQRETVRSIALSGEWTVDRSDGTPGDLRVTQSVFVLGGVLNGNMSGGAVTLINDGVGDLRGTVTSMNVAGNGRLAVGGKVGSDQLTINGNFTMFNSTSRVTFTTGAPTDPALIRALGTLTYPTTGQVQVRVNQFVPQPIGSAIKLIDFGTGASVPDLSKYALIFPLAGSGRGTLVLNNRVLSYVVTQNPCAADANGSGTLSVQDVFDYIGAFFANSPGADFNGVGGVTVQDLFDYLAAYFVGCA